MNKSKNLTGKNLKKRHRQAAALLEEMRAAIGQHRDVSRSLQQQVLRERDQLQAQRNELKQLQRYRDLSDAIQHSTADLQELHDRAKQQQDEIATLLKLRTVSVAIDEETERLRQIRATTQQHLLSAGKRGSLRSPLDPPCF